MGREGFTAFFHEILPLPLFCFDSSELENLSLLKCKAVVVDATLTHCVLLLSLLVSFLVPSCVFCCAYATSRAGRFVPFPWAMTSKHDRTARFNDCEATFLSVCECVITAFGCRHVYVQDEATIC